MKQLDDLPVAHRRTFAPCRIPDFRRNPLPILAILDFHDPEPIPTATSEPRANDRADGRLVCRTGIDLNEIGRSEQGNPGKRPVDPKNSQGRKYERN